MTLDVLIATYMPEGIERVARMDMPSVEGVRYIVSWQNHCGAAVPHNLDVRSDVEIHRYERSGVSNNRNNAMAHSSADIMLMADDDLSYTPDGLMTVIRTFKNNPQVEMASFMYDGDGPKCYPEEECDLTRRLPKGFFQTTFEIAVRRDSPAGELRFSPMFGPGAAHFSVGEDEIFLLTARKSGVNVRFFPCTITTHNGLTTGFRKISDPAAFAGFGAIIALQYPLTFLLRIPLKSYRLWRGGQAGPVKSFVGMMRGAFKILTTAERPWLKSGQ